MNDTEDSRTRILSNHPADDELTRVYPAQDNNATQFVPTSKSIDDDKTQVVTLDK